MYLPRFWGLFLPYASRDLPWPWRIISTCRWTLLRGDIILGYHRQGRTRHVFLGESRECESLIAMSGVVWRYNDIYFLCGRDSPAVGCRMGSAGSLSLPTSRCQSRTEIPLPCMENEYRFHPSNKARASDKAHIIQSNHWLTQRILFSWARTPERPNESYSWWVHVPNLEVGRILLYVTSQQQMTICLGPLPGIQFQGNDGWSPLSQALFLRCRNILDVWSCLLSFLLNHEPMDYSMDALSRIPAPRSVFAKPYCTGVASSCNSTRPPG